MVRITILKKPRFKNWKKPSIVHGKPTKYNWTVLYPKGLKLGRNSDIGAYTLIVAKHGVEIEEGVEIGSHCSIYSYSTIDGKTGEVVLKKGCKIGTHSSVMPGVTVGENTIIGAHSFVNKSLPPNVIAVGCPVKIIKCLRGSRLL